MTVKLLMDWFDSRNGKQYRESNLLTTDAGTESGLVAANVATSTLTNGTAYVAPPVEIQERPVTATTNVTGGIESLSVNGASIPILPLLTNEIGVKPVGVTINTNSPFGRTWFTRLVAPADFDAVKLVLYHPAATGAVYTACVAATETVLNDTDTNRWHPVVAGAAVDTLDSVDSTGWRSVTWAGASTVTPATGTATAQTVSESDWIPCSSVPRSDGSDYPAVMFRVGVAAASTSGYVGGQAATESATAANGGFIVQGRWATTSADYAGAPQTNSPTGTQNTGIISCAVIFRCRRPGISLMACGDSLTQASIVVADGLSTAALRTAAEITASGIPCGYINMGQASQAYDVWSASALPAITTYKPTVVAVQSFSPNGPPAPAYNTDAKMRNAVLRQSGYLQSLLSAVRAVGGISIVSSPLPCGVGVIVGATQDALRLTLNTQVLAEKRGQYSVDWDTDFTDGASPARINSTYLYTTDGTGVHVNEAGVARQGKLLTNKIKSIFGLV